MASRLITCPVSGCAERIDYQIDPLGILIDACTRYLPCDPECSRACAAQLDHDHEHVADATKVEVPLGRLIEVRSLMRAG